MDEIVQEIVQDWQKVEQRTKDITLENTNI